MINASPFSSSSTSSTAGSSANATPSTPSWATSSSSASDPNSLTPKAKKKVPLKWLIAGLGLLLLVVGGGAGFYLMQVNQDVRNQATGGNYGGCSQSGATRCVDGKQQVCNGTIWQGTNTNCSASPQPSAGSCNPATHCCTAGGCKVYVRQ